MKKVLQWGHDLAVMESGASTVTHALLVAQLQWGHDLAVMESWRSRSICGAPPCCFNGAMTLRSWKGQAAGDDPGRRLLASMGP